MGTSVISGVTIAEGVVREVRVGEISLARAGTSYVLDLAVGSTEGIEVGQKVRGEIRMNVAKITLIETGGKYIEPLAGTPRRVAGRIVEIDARANLLILDSGPFPVVCTPGPLQKASRFAVGQLVTMGVKPGASFLTI